MEALSTAGTEKMESNFVKRKDRGVPQQGWMSLTNPKFWQLFNTFDKDPVLLQQIVIDVRMMSAITAAVTSLCIFQSNPSNLELLTAIRITLAQLMGPMLEFCHFDLKATSDMVAQLMKTFSQLHLESMELKRHGKLSELDQQTYFRLLSLVIDAIKALLVTQENKKEAIWSIECFGNILLRPLAQLYHTSFLGEMAMLGVDADRIITIQESCYQLLTHSLFQPGTLSLYAPSAIGTDDPPTKKPKKVDRVTDFFNHLKQCIIDAPAMMPEMMAGILQGFIAKLRSIGDAPKKDDEDADVAGSFQSRVFFVFKHLIEACGYVSHSTKFTIGRDHVLGNIASILRIFVDEDVYRAMRDASGRQMKYIEDLISHIFANIGDLEYESYGDLCRLTGTLLKFNHLLIEPHIVFIWALLLNFQDPVTETVAINLVESYARLNQFAKIPSSLSAALFEQEILPIVDSPLMFSNALRTSLEKCIRKIPQGQIPMIWESFSVPLQNLVPMLLTSDMTLDAPMAALGTLGSDDEEPPKSTKKFQALQLCYFSQIFEIFLDSINVNFSASTLHDIIVTFCQNFFKPLVRALLGDHQWADFMYPVMEMHRHVMELYDEVMYSKRSPYVPSMGWFDVMGIQDELSQFFAMVAPIRKKSFAVQYLIESMAVRQIQHLYRKNRPWEENTEELEYLAKLVLLKRNRKCSCNFQVEKVQVENQVENSTPATIDGLKYLSESDFLKLEWRLITQNLVFISPYATDSDLARTVSDLVRPCQCSEKFREISAENSSENSGKSLKIPTIGKTSLETISSFQFLEISKIQQFVMPSILSHVLEIFKLNFQVEKEILDAMHAVVHPPSKKPITKMEVPFGLAKEIMENATSQENQDRQFYDFPGKSSLEIIRKFPIQYFQTKDISQATAFLFLVETFNLKSQPLANFPSLTREIIRDMSEIYPEAVSHVLAGTSLQLQIVTCHLFGETENFRNVEIYEISMKIFSNCCQVALQKHQDDPTDENFEDVLRNFVGISGEIFKLNFKLKCLCYAAFLNSMAKVLEIQDSQCHAKEQEEIASTFNLKSTWEDLIFQVEDWALLQVENDFLSVLPIFSAILELAYWKSSRFNSNFNSDPQQNWKFVGKFLKNINEIFLRDENLEKISTCLEYVKSLSKVVQLVKNFDVDFFSKMIVLVLYARSRASEKDLEILDPKFEQVFTTISTRLKLPRFEALYAIVVQELTSLVPKRAESATLLLKCFISRNCHADFLKKLNERFGIIYERIVKIGRNPNSTEISLKFAVDAIGIFTYSETAFINRLKYFGGALNLFEILVNRFPVSELLWMSFAKFFERLIKNDSLVSATLGGILFALRGLILTVVPLNRLCHLKLSKLFSTIAQPNHHLMATYILEEIVRARTHRNFVDQSLIIPGIQALLHVTSSNERVAVYTNLDEEGREIWKEYYDDYRRVYMPKLSAEDQ
eukprot:TRINITY_DN3091_c1_g1_i1.p1 TRINITY_DN3091_c1_g1~~TRINITY_DN3091_c1_g1_i1.p1  ORF type:complete len:1490 (-),score=547.82 TRINITY_DN3091_c1_g1_i1:42-4400(-)